MRKFIAFAGGIILSVMGMQAQNAPGRHTLQPMCDSLSSLLLERTTVKSQLKMWKVGVNGKDLTLNFDSTLSDYPWHPADQEWFKDRISLALDTIAPGYRVVSILSHGIPFKELSTPELTDSGSPVPYRYSCADPDKTNPRFIRRRGARTFNKGLSGRYIALWQSHGRYYNAEKGEWRWQRAPMHRTVEDLFTQSFVLPFLIPMLENSGAYVMTPRERDTQWREIITDNDPSFGDSADSTVRTHGFYSETGKWKDAGEGFADTKAVYRFTDNPFRSGSARMAACTPDKASATASWTPEIKERGRYAVYVSYKSLPQSTAEARYAVHHLGGVTEFSVNQKIGGGTWIYLGTFEFGEGTQGRVTLDNRGASGTYVSADAVKIGGGMGKLERGGTTSGMPSYAEGAHYWMQWAGVDSTLTRKWETDYTNDFATRGAWTEMMKEEKGIPFDLSLAFHSDAGIFPNDSIVGTLAIYTLKCENSRKFKDGRDRMMNRLLADYVQTQVVDDIREDFNPEWARRETWDKSYSECRTTGVPGIILETLSHQNFEDMKYGHNPAFKFTFCRAVYKGILKTLSEYYSFPYVVQPLPVNSFSAVLSPSGKVQLSWQPTPDPKEPTAGTDGYVLYRRTDDGAFDQGTEMKGNSVELSVEPGHIYSFKVAAYNQGGLSFPSETLSVGVQEDPKGTVMVVNNFERVSAPDFIDTPEYAGFDAKKDSGVPYMYDISFLGENYEFDRSSEYIDDEYPGHGASYLDNGPCIIAGNSFDYPYVHGKALMDLGYSFCSSSRQAFEDSSCSFETVDLICGKQKENLFTEKLMDAIRAYTSAGGNVIVSGANIASGDRISGFTEGVLGYKYVTYSATGSGKVGGYEFYNSPNPVCYSVECPDGITPAGKSCRILMHYPHSNIPAAILYKGNGYRTVSFGVPLETIKSESGRTEILRKFLQALQAN